MTTRPVTDGTGQIVKVSDQKVTYLDQRGKQIELTRELVKRQFGQNRASDIEVYNFMQICLSQGLNPFLKEIHLISYQDGKPATIVTGKDAFTQRAEANPEFDGYKAGIIVQREKEIIHVDGTFMLSSDVLLGGWFDGRRKDRSQSFFHTVSMEEYDKKQSAWKIMPATMIRKVAIVQGLRELFPTTLAGLYDASEMGVTVDQKDEPMIAQSTVTTNISEEVVIEETGEIVEPVEASTDSALCPLHGIEWRDGPAGGLYHYGMEPNMSCSPATLLAKVGIDAKGWTNEDINQHCRTNFNKTMSKLDRNEILQTYQFLTATLDEAQEVSEDPRQETMALR
jgi:phage recombination protein Bet